jgi:hypothetical protein
MAKIRYTSDYPAQKRAHARALAAPQVIPMVGDSERTRAAAMRGWRYQTQAQSVRDRLVEARYADWLADRDARLSPFAFVVTTLAKEV